MGGQRLPPAHSSIPPPVPRRTLAGPRRSTSGPGPEVLRRVSGECPARPGEPRGSCRVGRILGQKLGFMGSAAGSQGIAERREIGQWLVASAWTFRFTRWKTAKNRDTLCKCNNRKWLRAAHQATRWPSALYPAIDCRRGQNRAEFEAHRVNAGAATATLVWTIDELRLLGSKRRHVAGLHLPNGLSRQHAGAPASQGGVARRRCQRPRDAHKLR